MPQGPGRTARFKVDEIVVAVPHQDLVLRELAAAPGQTAAPRITASDPRLGLSIISVTHADGPDSADGAALDRLLAAVRANCAARYDGWTPTMGKNRLLDRIDGAGHIDGGGGVGGAGHIDGGGGGLPVPAEAGDVAPGAGLDRGRDVRVAVLDTKIFPHPDLAGRFNTDGPEALLRDPAGVPYHAGHATFVAGLIKQRASRAVMNIHNALDNDAEATAWDVARKMVEFADDGVGVLNLSMGCFTDDGQPPLLFARAVELLTPDIVIVAAAGNHGAGDSVYQVTPKTPFWPAALDDVVAVGAHDSDGRRATFSPDTPWVTLSAPGVDVVSTFLSGKVTVPSGAGSTELRSYDGYASWSGTSFSAAIVTGEIAAGTITGERAPREALNDLLQQAPGQPGADVWAYDHRE